MAAATSAINCDYAIVFSFSKRDTSSSAATFQRLVTALADAGLATAVRQGRQQTLLILTKVDSEEHLLAEVYRSRTRDWLHGVRLSQPEKDQTLNQALHPAERLRIVYQMITNPTSEGGAGITPKHGEWEQVESVFALHDHDFNKHWLKSWATSYSLKVEDLDQIRDMFGEKVAFYFAFTQSYFTALVGIAIFGAAAWTTLGNFSPIYGIVNSILCAFFVEYWKRQEYDLAVRWGVRGVSSIETKRLQFKPQKSITDPITGEKTLYYPVAKRFQRQLLQIPFILIAATALGALIATCFGIEIFVSEVYDGPLQGILVFLPTGIITTMQPLVLGLLSTLAERLNSLENYETEASFASALTQKIFVLNFITSYLPIFLTAFVYVPFATILVPYLDVFQLTVQPFADNKAQMETPKAGFHINPDRLKKQVIYFTVTAQIVNQAMEVILPYVKRKGLLKYRDMQNKRAAKNGGAVPDVAENDAPDEAKFLSRVRDEAELDVYDVTVDFREMVVQYGYLALFSVVWPLTPISFLVNNWFELRTDAAKIAIESQRPTPYRAESIGPWLDSLGFLTWLGSITTAAVVHLFSNGGLGPDGSPRDVKAWLLLVSIFVSEHSYMLVQWLIRYGISKLDSPGRQKERVERLRIRKRYLEESVGEQAAKIAPKMASKTINRQSLEDDARLESQAANATADTAFWRRQRTPQETVQIGTRYIQQGSDAESKKSK